MPDRRERERTPAMQLTLNLGHRPALGREDFLVTPANELAVAWIDRWPDWPGGSLCLYGPSGSGKSHLLQVWRQASGAVELTGAALVDAEPPELLGEARHCAIDDAARAAAVPAAEQCLLHLYNLVRERGGDLLLTAERPPAHWPVALPDLRSRLVTLSAVALQPPDDVLIEALLVKLFADRQLRVGQDVVSYLVARMERSFAAARDLVAAIDAAALAARREVTIALVREVLRSRKGDAVTDEEG
ncbi:MAG: DNA replication protein [Kiloniellales bacterium]